MSETDLVKNLKQNLDSRMNKALSAFQSELDKVRTGKASPSLVSSIMVSCYGAEMPLEQLANVTTPDATTIAIQPWDEGLLGGVEKAISASDLGLMPNNDGKVVRINLPPLSEERRKDLVKLVKKLAEEARVGVRAVRRDGNDKVKQLLKDKVVSEDDQHFLEQEIQKQTDAFIKKIDDFLAEKEKELMTI